MKDSSAFTELPAPPWSHSGDPARLEDRLPKIIGASADLPSLIKNASVGIIGTGAVGGNAAIHVARMQPDALYLFDPKVYKPVSILTQPIGPEAIGQPKAFYLGRLCKAISPHTRVFCFQGGIEEIDNTALRGIDVFLLASDNLPAEVAAGVKSRQLGVPLLQGSVHGETLVVQVRTFSNREEAGPCLACGFHQAEWSMMGREVEFACDAGSAPDDATRTVQSQPTFSLPSLCSLAADLMVLHLLKILAGFGCSVEDTLYEYCGHTGRTFTTPLRGNPACPCDHTIWTFLSANKPLSLSSLAELAESADVTIVWDDPPLFQVPGFDWVDELQCAKGHLQPYQRFVRQDEPVEPCGCAICGGQMSPKPLSRRGAVSAVTLGSAFQVPLRDLGVDFAPQVRVRTEGAQILWHFRPSPAPSA